MGFRIVDHKACGITLLPGVGKIVFDLFPCIVLEKFRIGPIHIGGIQKGAGNSRISPQTFQKKDCIGKFLSCFGNDIFPRLMGDHVTGITAEAVHAPHTPDPEDLCQILP